MTNKEKLNQLEKTLKEIQGLQLMPRTHIEALILTENWYRVWDIVKELKS